MSKYEPRILIVDDVLENLDLLRLYLTHYKFEVICASSGFEAIETARRERPDLILLDVMMDGLDGLSVCQQLKQDDATKQIPVMFVSARAGKQDIALGLDAGAADYVSKPFSFVDVKNRIDNMLAGGLVV
ncbi:MAG: Adenylate/guanylate cyclase [Cyanobacteria bacterium RYN_339]|nr:Adenylate/guanylate cyclase [Cyanobacteria bacterium RYN_339]